MNGSSDARASGFGAGRNQIIDGTLVIGGIGSGKTTLLQRMAAQRFERNLDSCLFFVGEQLDCGIRKLVSPSRLFEAGEPVSSVIRRRGAVVMPFAEGREGRLQAYKGLCSVLEHVIELETKERVILVMDGFVSILQDDDGAHFMNLLEGAVQARAKLHLLASFFRYGQLQSFLGERGVRFFRRFSELAILRALCGSEMEMFVNHFTGEGVPDIPVGKALIISQHVVEWEPIR